MRRFIIILILFISIKKLNAQINSGARSMGMADSGTILEDVFSLGSNQAGIASLNKLEIALTYQEHNYPSDVRSIAVFLAVPIPIGVMGLSINRYGLNREFNDLSAGLTLSHLFLSKLAVAGTLNYHYTSIYEFELNRALNFDFGTQCRLSNDWLLGLHFINSFSFSKPRIISNSIPTQVKLGSVYNLSYQTMISVESEYDLKNSYDLKLGIEYSIIESLKLRGGTSLLPFKQYVGVGKEFNKLGVDAASSFHSQLGTSLQISLNYGF